MKSFLPVLIAVAVLALLQLVLGDAAFVTYHATRVGVWVIMAVSLNIINGMTGQFSIGHAGFMAVGAYASSLLTLLLHQYRIGFLPDPVTAQLFFLTALLAGGALAGVAGFLVGLPSLRLKGDYLAIVTLGFGEIIRVIVTNMKVTGGALGLSSIPPHTSLFMVWFWVFVVVLLARRLADSSHGRSLLAIREDEVAAEAMGVDTTSYKVRAFVVSSFFAGVAGGLFAHFLQAINPNSFTFVQSIEVVVMVVAGGLGSTTGAVVAATFLVMLPEGLRTLFLQLGGENQSLAQKVDQVRMPIYGLLLVVIMLTRPQGIFGTHELWDLWKRKKGAPEKPKAVAA
ncbi:MAG: branched-chain amino acid ABC transporter permease [Deltaproteobacteria bacterium]|nr:branched-chain amino acid ABC transporter permease [Deltaproteobacteria bacterium]